MHFTRHSVFEDRTGRPGPHVPIITRGKGWTDLGRPRQRVHRRSRRPVRRPGRPRPRRARRGGGQAGHGARLLPAVVLRPPAGHRARRAPRRATPPATSTGSSSPPAAARPSRPPGSWPSSTSSSPASRPSTRSSPAPSPTTARRRAPCRSPASRPPRRCSSRWCPARIKVPNTNLYRAPEHLRDDEKAFGRWAADRIAEAIEFEGPDTVAAVFLEPVQNSGGCFPPPRRLLRARPRDLRRVRRAARLRRGRSAPSAASGRCSPATTSTTCPTSSPAPRA